MRPTEAVTWPAPIELAVVVPTLNEHDNIHPFIARLSEALAGISWELVFVDDNSADGTADLVRSLARYDRRVRVVQRIGQRGLASAVIAGALSTSAPVIAVMDVDMQHDEKVLPDLFRAVAFEGNDLAVGSRYMAGGSLGEWDESRAAISRSATRLASLLLKTPLTDPMSGFFAVSRDALMESLPRMSAIGFKILVDLVASSPKPLKVREVPYVFGTRHAGESKLDAMVAWEYLMLLADKTVGRVVPVRFLMFALVGGFGVGVHLAALFAGLNLIGLTFMMAQAAAVWTAMTVNFGLNNVLTYRDRRLKGWRLLSGLLTFYAVCLIGAAANIGIGTWIYEIDRTWWLAGVSGALAGAVWNYAASSALTWRR
jgi:dolichol-phosphate mannosyltransferase